MRNCRSQDVLHRIGIHLDKFVGVVVTNRRVRNENVRDEGRYDLADLVVNIFKRVRDLDGRAKTFVGSSGAGDDADCVLNNDRRLSDNLGNDKFRGSRLRSNNRKCEAG